VAASIAGLEKEARYCEFIAIGLRGCTGGLSLIAAQMQSRQHRAASRIEKFVRVPSGRQRSGFRLAVADHHGHNQIRVVEGGAVGVRYRIAELATLVDRTRRLRRAVATDAARKGELLEQLVQSVGILRNAAVDFGIVKKAVYEEETECGRGARRSSDR